MASEGLTQLGSQQVERVRRTTRQQLKLVDKSLKARINRVRSRFLYILQATVGGGLAFYFAHHILGHKQPFFAPMAVIIILGLSGADRIKRAMDLAVGGILGVLIGTSLVDLLGTGPIHMVVIIGLSLLVASFLSSSQMVSNQVAVGAILIATILPPEQMGGVSRAIDAVTGAVIGIAMIALIPVSPLGTVRNEISKVLGVASSVLSDVARGLKAQDPAIIQDARDAVRGTQNAINSMLAAAKGGRETAKVSPFFWNRGHKLRSLERILTPVDNTIRGVRVLARRSLILAEDGDPASAEQISLLEDLSDIMFDISDLHSKQTRKDRAVHEAEAIPEFVRRLRLIAARCTMDVVSHQGANLGALSEYAILAQTRSVVVDLLMICGMSRESAVAQLAPTSEHPAYPPEVIDESLGNQ